LRASSRRASAVLKLTREAALGAAGEAIRLQPFDAIFVSTVSEYMEQKSGTLSGQVARPGTYPVVPGSTTVRELIRMAGGLQRDSSLENTVLRRHSVDSPLRLSELGAMPWSS
jgi:hypothetical protein